MPEFSEIQESAASTPKPPVASAKTTNPESAERGNPVDVLLVFGQGPVKPLLRQEELDSEMLDKWETFKKDPLHSDEPDFRVIEGKWFLDKLQGLNEEQTQAKMAEWQSLGRFGLNRWGREQALAAGYALVSGYTDKVLLSGGKTIPSWARDKMPAARLDQWPSEAELMADIIRRTFGQAYEKVHGKPIDASFVLEDASTNTLENFANGLNQNPDLMNNENKLGLLAANFHISRSARIAAIFAPNADIQKKDSAQNILELRLAEKGNKETYKKILSWMSDPSNPDFQKRQLGEERWTNGLEDPQFVTYWLGYIGMVEDPAILQETIRKFSSDPKWTNQAEIAFNTAGLSFKEVSGLDLTSLPQDEFKKISDKLILLTKEGYRQVPPAVS